MTSNLTSASGTNSRALIKTAALKALLSSPILFAVAGTLLFFFDDLPNALRWPARFAILAASVFGLWRFPRESRLTVQWAGRIYCALRAGAVAAIERRAGTLLGVERLLAIAAIATALIPFCLMVRDMSWSSLRTDEITSVSRYSSQGPWHVMSNYQRANNHILFNLLNSLTPWADSMHPLRARLWSIISMIGLVAAAGFWVWRASPAGAAWMICAICLNTYHLHLELQARAYGMASLLAFLAAAGFIRHAIGGGRNSLALVAVATVLGTYAVPYFIVFGGLLLLMLFCAKPTTDRFLAGFWALAAIALLHLPVIGQMLDVATSYDEDYEPGFASASSAWSVMYYLVPGGLPMRSIGHSAAFMGLLFLTALHPAVARSIGARAGLAVAGAAIGFVAFCYLLESPPRRIAAFVVIPFALGLVFAGVSLLSHYRLRSIGRLTAPVACAGLLAFALYKAASYEFEPTQRWREFGRALTLLYPSGVDVWVDSDLRNNRAYLDARFNVVEGGSFDLEKFRLGALVIHDANYSPRTMQQVIKSSELPPNAGRVAFDTSGGETVLWFQADRSESLDGISKSGRRSRFEVSFATQAEPTPSQEQSAVLTFKTTPSRVALFTKEQLGEWRPLPRDRFMVEGMNLFMRLPAGSSSLAVEADFDEAFNQPAHFHVLRMSKDRS